MMEITSRLRGKRRCGRAIKQYKETMDELLGEGFGGRLSTQRVYRTGSYLSSRAIAPICAASPAEAASHTRGDQSMGAASSAILSPASGGTQSRQPRSQSGSPASGGITSTDLENRLKAAFKPVEKVPVQTPSDTPVAAYIQKEDAATAYMQPVAASKHLQDLQWLPQEAADWLYQATHYSIPLLQTLLGTHKSFNLRGQYLDAEGKPASGGQLAAFWGAEIGSRWQRAMIPYDCDADFVVFVTPCCNFRKA